jgi:hypothetical protein
VTVVDGTGRRFPIRGMEGQTLVELLENQEGPLDVSDCEQCADASAASAHCSVCPGAAGSACLRHCALFLQTAP